MKGGYFHKICERIKENPEKVKRTLMLTLAHIFGRRVCRITEKEYAEKNLKKSPSAIFLPPLPKLAVDILKQHNDETRRIFTTYVSTFVDQHMHDTDDTLPISGLHIGAETATDIQIKNLESVKIRSPFVALSGHGDDFSSVSDLCSTVRAGVFLEQAVIPQLDIYPSETSKPLNAYLYDYFMHGDKRALEQENGIRKGDMWFILNDFSLVLATIVASLSNYLLAETTSEMDMLDLKGGGDIADIALDDKVSDKEAGAAGQSNVDPTVPDLAAGVSNLGMGGKKKNAKVVDSWDDEGGDDEEDDVAEIEEDDGTTQIGSEGGISAATWADDGRASMRNVLLAFVAVKTEFDEKFKAMWA